MTILKVLLFFLIMFSIVAIIVILLEIPVGARDVSQTPRLFDEHGRLKKKFLPVVIISLLLGMGLLLFQVL